MSKKSVFCFAMLLSAVSISSANAHGVWVEERHGQFEAVYGDGPQIDSYKAEKISGSYQWQGNKKTNASIDSQEKYVVILADNAEMISLTLDNGYWTENKSGKWFNKSKTNVKEAKQGSHYIKYGAYVKSSKASLSGLKDEFPLAITSAVNPILVGVGKELEINVWLDGKPAVDALVYIDYKNMKSQTVKTDSNGLAKITIRNEGLNVIAAQASKPLADQTEADSLNMVSTLSFVALDTKH